MFPNRFLFLLQCFFFLLGIIAGCGTLVGFPVIRGYLSLLVPNTQQGALFSGTCFVETLADLFGNIIFGLIYGQTSKTVFPGLVFIIAGLIGILSVVLAM